MDKTETYIKMCEKAVEIQTLSPKLGEDYPHWYSALFYVPYIEDVSLFHYDNDEGRWILGDYGDETEGAIWLPTQSDMQKMFNLNPLPLISLFSAYVNDVPVYGMEWSMEQLWLAFVMSKRFGKVWKGEDWVKEV